jgi:AraC-like DNA-binding protein
MHADTLCHLLGAVRLAGATLIDADLMHAQPLRLPATGAGPDAKAALFCHLVADGTCVVQLNARSEVNLQAGDVVALPGGVAHMIRAMSRRARLICGTFFWDGEPFRPLINVLPLAISCARNTGAADASISDMYALMAREAKHDRAGQQGVLARLGEALITKIATAYLVSSAHDSDIAALHDHHVSRAISLLHGNPTGEWTLDRLSREVGMSRSALASRFTSLIGIPPIQYLAMWRIRLASGLLKADKGSIAQIAADVGYDSEAAFNRAFKRMMGVPPAAWRRTRRGRETQWQGSGQAGPVLARSHVN